MVDETPLGDSKPEPKPQRRVSEDFGILFAPGAWTATERLRRFVGPPFKDQREVRKGVSVTEGHLHKFCILVGLANNLATTLGEDRAELEEQGHTPATRSKEYAAVVETLICSLYSAIDGVRLSIYGCYKGIAKVQKGSNGELFKNAHEKKYGAGFPEPIRAALAEAHTTWFPDLRKYRTELIHGEVGSCHLDEKTEKITHMHTALGSGARALVIEDIASELSRLYSAVYGLAELVYDYLFQQLEPITRRTLCGVYKGRFYEREVAPASDLSLSSGVCLSLKWFEKEPGCECPLRTVCGAYTRAVAENAAPPPTDKEQEAP